MEMIWVALACFIAGMVAGAAALFAYALCQMAGKADHHLGE